MSLHRDNQARSLLDAAALALHAGQPDAAARHIEAALRLHPDSDEARLLAARIELQRNRPAAALTNLTALDFYRPDLRDTPAVALLRAEVFLRAGDHAMARPLLERLARAFPDDVRPHRLLASLYGLLELDEPAAAGLRQVLRLEPSDAAARRTLAELLAPRDAEAAAELLVHDPATQRDPALRIRVARLLRDAGRLRDARDRFDALLAERPDDAELLAETGELARACGADDVAMSRLNRAGQLAVRDRRHDAATDAALARTHMHTGRLLTAGRCWWRLVRRDPADVHAWAGLLACALAAERFQLVDRVQPELERRTSPRERRQLLAKHWLDLSAGQTIHDLRHAGQEPPVAALSPLTQLLQQAAGTLAAHAQRLPGRADTHYHLAVCRHALGDDADAAESVLSAVRINGRYAAAKTLLARLPRLAA